MTVVFELQFYKELTLKQLEVLVQTFRTYHFAREGQSVVIVEKRSVKSESEHVGLGKCSNVFEVDQDISKQLDAIRNYQFDDAFGLFVKLDLIAIILVCVN